MCNEVLTFSKWVWVGTTAHFKRWPWSAGGSEEKIRTVECSQGLFQVIMALAICPNGIRLEWKRFLSFFGLLQPSC